MAVEDWVHQLRRIRRPEDKYWDAGDIEDERARQFWQRMDRREAEWQAGDITALVTAIEDCEWNSRPLPVWLASAVKKTIWKRMSDAEARTRREFWVHFTRWFEVDVLHRVKKKSWESSYAEAAERVADGFAAGEPETVAASYKLIQRAGGRDATFESYRRIVQERGGK